ncbi:MAG TPA: peptidoglycan recognition family protein, partial [Thermomicrobiales bacterium]|nr:peptidoglycan recognition family protein [Thermomicrobiales bacterium]
PPITWVGSPNFFANRAGVGNPTDIVYHCTDDLVLANTTGWFLNPSSKASANFVIDRDGTVYQFVSSKDGPWSNGEINKPRTDIPELTRILTSGMNPNDYCITYEFVATPETPPTQAQYDAAIRLSRYFCHPGVYAINPNRSHQLRHADIDSVNRANCPGPHFDLTQIITAIGGDPNQIAA